MFPEAPLGVSAGCLYGACCSARSMSLLSTLWSTCPQRTYLGWMSRGAKRCTAYCAGLQQSSTEALFLCSFAATGSHLDPPARWCFHLKSNKPDTKKHVVFARCSLHLCGPHLVCWVAFTVSYELHLWGRPSLSPALVRFANTALGSSMCLIRPRCQSLACLS